MAKDQACKLQILSVKHPDLLRVVDRMFEKFATILEVQRMIERQFHEDVGNTAVSNYKEKHWRVHQDMVCEKKTAMKAVSQLVGEDGLTAGVNALLWESLEEMTVPQLMAFKKVLNDGQKVELMKKQFALYAQEHRQKMKDLRERREAAKGRTPAEEGLEDFESAQRVVQQVKEIFGIGMTEYEPPNQTLLGAAKVSPSPEALAVSGKEST